MEGSKSNRRDKVLRRDFVLRNAVRCGVFFYKKSDSTLSSIRKAEKRCPPPGQSPGVADAWTLSRRRAKSFASTPLLKVDWSASIHKVETRVHPPGRPLLRNADGVFFYKKAGVRFSSAKQMSAMRVWISAFFIKKDEVQPQCGWSPGG
jgi:hypothetical protein